MTKEEWLARYKKRFIERLGLTEAQAEKCAQAESVEVLSGNFADDPEGSADMEMSYWEP